MGEFRIGRMRAAHTYPEPPRGAGPSAFARNFASGPSAPTTVGPGGIQIPWDFIESGAAPGVDVPITPHVTGRLIFSGVVVVHNTTGNPVTAHVQVQVNGSTILVPNVQETVDANGQASLAFEIFDPLAAGTSYNIQVQVTGSVDSALQVNVDSSTIEIEEKPVATG